MWLSLGLSITVFLSTALVTWSWIKIASARDIHDYPERRRLHLTQVPRAGGVSIALVMAFTALLYFLLTPYVNSYIILILIPIVMYAALGFWDDLMPFGADRKLFLHLIAAVVVVFSIMFLSELGYRVAIMVALAYLVFVNIWNFMDGSNGMVGMQSLLCAVGFMVLSNNQSDTHDLALIIAACCLGFLPFNFPVARVFLGDVGSHVLGAALIGLAFVSCVEAQWTVLEVLVLLSALWIDAVLTFIRRYLRGFKVTQAHRSHLYQYAVRRGLSHASVCLYYAAWTLAMIFLVGMSRQLPETRQSELLFATVALGCLVHQWLRLFVLKSGHSPKAAKPTF